MDPPNAKKDQRSGADWIEAYLTAVVNLAFYDNVPRDCLEIVGGGGSEPRLRMRANAAGQNAGAKITGENVVQIVARAVDIIHAGASSGRVRIPVLSLEPREPLLTCQSTSGIWISLRRKGGSVNGSLK